MGACSSHESLTGAQNLSLDVEGKHFPPRSTAKVLDCMPIVEGRIIEANVAKFGLFGEGETASTPSLKDGKFFGPCQLIQGDLYIGQWSGGKRVGKGLLIKPDGTMIEGQFSNNILVGECRIISPDGKCYVGPVQDDAPSGQGVLTSPDGYSYKGEFVRGLPQGIGTETLSNGQRFTGQFHKGLRFGKGNYLS